MICMFLPIENVASIMRSCVSMWECRHVRMPFLSRSEPGNNAPENLDSFQNIKQIQKCSYLERIKAKTDRQRS